MWSDNARRAARQARRDANYVRKHQRIAAKYAKRRQNEASARAAMKFMKYERDARLKVFVQNQGAGRKVKT